MHDIDKWRTLARVLLDAAGDQVTALGHPLWVQVLARPDGWREPLGEGLTLAFSDAGEALMGWVATPDCHAVGVIGTGRLHPIRGSAAAGVSPSSEHVRMACLVARDGAVAWHMGLGDGTPPGGTVAVGPPSEGRLLDCLRRCFGLPTPPPPAGPTRLQVIVWLVSALDHAETTGRRLAWSEVSRLHPAARALSTQLGDHLGPELSTDLLRMAGTAWSWDDIRLQTGSEGFLDQIIDPGLARWMDEGMFARWVLASLPSPDELLAVLRPRLTPAAARRLAHAVHASSPTEAAPAT